MKKLFAALAITFFATASFATDRTGEFALGYQSSLGAGTGSNGQWSVKYGLASNTTIQGIVGFSLTDADDTSRFSVGARFLYDLIENENSDFYTGLGLVFHTGGDFSGVDADGDLLVNLPLGFAFSLANAPEVEFSAEMGLNFNYAIAAETWSLDSVGGGLGAVFTAGAHYYF